MQQRHQFRMVLDLREHLLLEPIIVVNTDVFWVKITHQGLIVSSMLGDLWFPELGFNLHDHILDLRLTVILEVNGNQTEIDT